MFCEFCYAFFGLLVFLWVGSKFNRHLQFIYAFVMFGYIFPTLAFLIFPFCRVFLKKYNGKGEGTKKTTTYLWSEINGWYFNINYTEVLFSSISLNFSNIQTIFSNLSACPTQKQLNQLKLISSIKNRFQIRNYTLNNACI